MKEEGKNIDANEELDEAIINLAGQVVNAYINDTGEDRALDPLLAAYKVLDAGFQKYAAAIRADERRKCANRAVDYAIKKKQPDYCKTCDAGLAACERCDHPDRMPEDERELATKILIICGVDNVGAYLKVANLIGYELARQQSKCANRAVEYALGQNWVSDDNDGDAIAFYSAMINPEGNHV